jgi:putative ABC transport system permease protein
LGAWAEHLFPKLLGPYLPFSIASGIPLRAAAEGFVAGVLIPLLLSAAPLLSIRRMRPNVLLRRNLETDDFSRRQNLLFLGFAVAGVAGVSAVASGAKPSVAGIMIVGLVAGLIAFGLAALAFRSVIPKLLALSRRFVSAPVRYGLLNLSRPGNPLSSIVVALGLGVSFVYMAYLMEGSLLDQVMQYSPFHGAGIYLLNVGPSQKDEVLNFVRSRPAVERADLDPFVVLRLIAINGNSRIAEVRRTWFAAISGSQPRSVEVSSGKWWSESDPSSWIALSSRAARAMSAQVGDSLTFSNGAELVKVRVAAIHRGSSAQALRYHLTLSPAAVSESRVTYNGAVWIAPSASSDFQRQVRARYPSILVMSQADIAAVIQDTAGHVASVLRLVSAVSLTGGAIILSASLFAMRMQRSREISILKSLGATRKTIAVSLLSEFTMLGMLAAALGIAMGSGLSNLLGRYAFDPPLPPFPGWTAAGLTLAITVAVTNVAGLASGLSLLGLKPSEILRGERS